MKILWLLFFGYVYISNGQRFDSTFIDTGDSEIGLFEGQLVDIGSLNGGRVGLSGMGSGFLDSFGGLRGGSLRGVSRRTDFITGLRQCPWSICTLQVIPRRCRYTPIRQRRFGGYCTDCPIDVCEIDSGRWRPRRRRRMRRLRRFMCRILGICLGPWRRGGRFGREGRGWRGGRGGGRFGDGCRGGFDCPGVGRGRFGGGCRDGLCPGGGLFGRGRGLMGSDISVL